MWMILGGSGQVGKALTSTLHDRGKEYISLGRADADLKSPESLMKAISRYSPDVVVNCGAYTNVDRAEFEKELAFLINCTGAKNIAAMCSTAVVPLIHLSTDYVFSGSKQDKYLWSDKGDPISVYGESKYCGEEMVNLVGGEVSKIVRTSWVYSEYSNNFVKWLVRLALMNKEITVATDQIGTPTSAKHLSHFLIDLHDSGAKNTIYHGVGFGSCSRFELARSVYELVNADTSLIKEGKKEDFDNGSIRPNKVVLDNSTLHGGVDLPMVGWYYQLMKSIPTIVESIEMESKVVG